MGEYTFFIFPLFYVIWILVSEVTVFLHEMGHAIPALIYTRQPVSVYLGSYGDHINSLRIKISDKFVIYFKFKLFKLRRGMIRHHSTNLSLNQHILISACGPLISFTLASIAAYAAFAFHLHGFFKLLTVIFSFSAILDLINLYPYLKPIITDSGSNLYCDGRSIQILLGAKRNYRILNKAYKFYAEANYRLAIIMFEKLDREYINAENLTFIISAYNQLRQFSKGKSFCDEITDISVDELSSKALLELGFIESHLDKHEDALSYYNKAILLDENDINSLSNRAFTFILLEKYVEAIEDFDKTLKMKPDFAYGWANKGLAKIKLGLLDDGLQDIRFSLSIDDDEAYAHRALGLYYFETGDFELSIKSFKKARTIDNHCHGVDSYIKMAESKLPAIK